VIDVPSRGHDRELAFWSGAVDQPLNRSGRFPNTTGTALYPPDLQLLVQQLGHSRPVHLDIHADDLAVEVTGWSSSRWAGLAGAQLVDHA
jgi:hypothetical protein